MLNVAPKNMEQALIFPQVPSGEEEHVSGILGNIKNHLGFIPDGLRLFSISPPLLETFVGNIGYFNMGGYSTSTDINGNDSLSSFMGCWL